MPQIHSSQYRSPEQITTGSVLVVGSASSGIQICRLLGESGRFGQLHMAVSKVMVLPRRVMGIQIHRLLHAFGLFDVKTTSRLGRLMYSGLETRGDPITKPTPKDLARLHGVRLFPKLAGVEGSMVLFADGQTLDCDDLTVIWCTGFTGGHGLIRGAEAELLDESGALRHNRGVATGLPGLFFAGLRYQHSVASHDIYGVASDARYIADEVRALLRSDPARAVPGLDRGHSTRP